MAPRSFQHAPLPKSGAKRQRSPTVPATRIATACPQTYVSRIGAGSMPIGYVIRTPDAENNTLPTKSTRRQRAQARQAAGA